MFEKTEKKSIFCFPLVNIGALCSKTLGHFRQALEWSYQKNFCIFPNIIFQKILNLAKKVEKCQFCHLLHKNESLYCKFSSFFICRIQFKDVKASLRNDIFSQSTHIILPKILVHTES